LGLSAVPTKSNNIYDVLFTKTSGVNGYCAVDKLVVMSI
jgi:hypothetical protein